MGSATSDAAEDAVTRARAYAAARREGEDDGARAKGGSGDETPTIDAMGSAGDRVRKARAYADALAKARAATATGADAPGGVGGDAAGGTVTDEGSAGRSVVTPDATTRAGKPAEAKKREVSVSILTKDGTYDPFDEDERAVGFEVEGSVYKPKVSTWGVFERPPDISKTYGGGRTIKREELEDEEAIQRRRARVAKKLAKYREDQGMNMRPAEMEAAQAALTQAEEAIRQGYMLDALEILEPWALERMPPKTELGGKMIFNYALCLDNVQRRDEAMKQYRRCIGNQYGTVSKQADRMLWGMTTASKKMKADLFDYMDAAKLDAYDEYLIKMANEKFAGEIDEEEVRELNTQAVVAMLALFGTPALFLAYLTMQ